MPDTVSIQLDDVEMHFKLVAEEVFGPSPAERVDTAAQASDKSVPASKRPMIDLDADPFVPDGMSVERHKKGGMFDFDPAKIALYLSERQKGDNRIGGYKLREKLEAQPVYNANLLDWYLHKENQHFIPEEWKGKAIFFWGTIYRFPVDRLCVRCLFWSGVGWCWGCCWLGSVWISGCPAAVPAS